VEKEKSRRSPINKRRAYKDDFAFKETKERVLKSMGERTIRRKEGCALDQF